MPSSRCAGTPPGSCRSTSSRGRIPLKFDFNPPVSLGAYILHGYDPNGQWFTWQKRDDWQRTSLARFGEPGPRYVTYLDPGPPDKRVIAQLNHELDIIHDTSPEGVFTLVKESPKSKGWFEGFPYGHPDPTLAQVIFNHQNPKFQNRDVRWALALALDIKAISMAGYRGAATISAIAVPPTGTHPDYYHKPMEEWLAGFELDTGKKVIKPYDPTIGGQIAEMLRPSMGDQIPSGPATRSARPSGLAGGSRISRRRPSSSSAPVSPAAATTGTCRTASASRSSSWSRVRRGR